MTAEREPISGLQSQAEHLSSLIDRRQILHAEWTAREDRFDPSHVSPEIALRRLQRHAAMEVITASHMQKLASTQEQIKLLEDEPRLISKAEEWRSLVALRQSQREEFVRFSTQGRISAALTHRWEESFFALYDQPQNDPELQRGLELLEEKRDKAVEQSQQPKPAAPAEPVESETVAVDEAEKQRQEVDTASVIAEVQRLANKGILIDSRYLGRTQDIARGLGQNFWIYESTTPVVTEEKEEPKGPFTLPDGQEVPSLTDIERQALEILKSAYEKDQLKGTKGIDLVKKIYGEDVDYRAGRKKIANIRKRGRNKIWELGWIIVNDLPERSRKGSLYRLVKTVEEKPAEKKPEPVVTLSEEQRREREELTPKPVSQLVSGGVEQVALDTKPAIPKVSEIEKRDPEVRTRISEILDKLEENHITKPISSSQLTRAFPRVKTYDERLAIEKGYITPDHGRDHHPAFKPQEVAVLIYVREYGNGLKPKQVKILRNLINDEWDKRSAQK